MVEKERSEDLEKEEVEALCRECGHGFKAFMDRVIGKDEPKSELTETITCPVCGCNECSVVHKGSS